jgi:RHS repeat-associated protein
VTALIEQESTMTALADLRYGYDVSGRLVAVGTAEAPEWYAAYTYQPDGLVGEERLSGGVLLRRNLRDPLGRLVALVDPAFTQRLSFRQDGEAKNPLADGHIAAESVAYHGDAFDGPAPADRASTFRYDAFGRLVEARPASGSGSLAVGYDPSGNITALRRDGVASEYTYESGTNRVISVAQQDEPPVTYAYTADGAVRADGRLGLRLDRDRLTGRTAAATRVDTSMGFGYDAAGFRVLRDDGAGRRLTVRGTGRAPLVEIDPEQGTTVHVHGPSGLVALNIGGVHHAVSTDNRGSVRVVYTGTKAGAQFDYGPFGELTASTGELAETITPRYTGQDWDEGLGLYDYGARLYDPVLGRFLSPDPAHQGPSPYAYCGNDPIGTVDPDGQRPVKVYVYRGSFYWFRKGAVVPYARYRADLHLYKILVDAWGAIDWDHGFSYIGKSATRFNNALATVPAHDRYLELTTGEDGLRYVTLRAYSQVASPHDASLMRMKTVNKSPQYKRSRARNRQWGMNGAKMMHRVRVLASRRGLAQATRPTRPAPKRTIPEPAKPSKVTSGTSTATSNRTTTRTTRAHTAPSNPGFLVDDHGYLLLTGEASPGSELRLLTENGEGDGDGSGDGDYVFFADSSSSESPPFISLSRHRGSVTGNKTTTPTSRGPRPDESWDSIE